LRNVLLLVFVWVGTDARVTTLACYAHSALTVITALVGRLALAFASLALSLF
jgi:hypothetical protein